MPDEQTANRSALRDDNTMLHVVYGLYALNFLLGIAIFVGVVIAYIQRGKLQTAMQQSHITWQIRTFWLALLAAVIAFILPLLLGSVVIAFLIWVALTVWFIYRIARGWLRLKDGLAIDDPMALI